MALTALFASYIVLFLAFVVSTVVYLVLGQRVLRAFQARYPAEWKLRGEPTFVSFAILGSRWWRPITADNFFTYREYLALDDSELTRRAEVVRAFQRVAFAASTGFVIIGLLTYVIFR